jgi:membrane protein YdbS with pleckstrin-like domain
MTQLWRAEFDKLPPEVNKYLLPQELDQRVISTRRHQAVLLWPLFFALAGLVIALILSGTILRGQGGLLTVVWVIWVLLALHLLWATVNWFIDYYVVTSQRMMLTSGLLTRRVDMMPLGKVTDMSFRRSLGGRIFGYGEFVVESAGQDQALRNVTYLPYPERLYRDVCDMLWPAKPPPDCKMCNGSGNIVLAEERRLVTATCPNCDGTGKRPPPTVLEYPEAIVEDDFEPSSDPNQDPYED